MKNWKTTFAGALSAGAYAVANLEAFTWKTALVCFGLAFAGFVQKDFNVSNAPSPLKEGEVVK